VYQILQRDLEIVRSERIDNEDRSTMISMMEIKVDNESQQHGGYHNDIVIELHNNYHNESGRVGLNDEVRIDNEDQSP
jgi:hypothetical protein